MKYSIKYIAIIILIFILLGTNLKNLNETFVNFYQNENKFKVVVTTYNPNCKHSAIISPKPSDL